MIRWSDQARVLLKPNAAWCALAAAAALAGVGVLAIATVAPALAVVQARWAVIGLAAMLVCILPRPRYIVLAAFPLLAMSLALLVLLLAPGVPSWLVHPVNGARCWINLGLMSFEPAELAKIAFVLALARYLRYRDNYRTLRGLLPPFVLMFVPVILILKQPDLGMALLFAPTLFVVLVVAGARMRHLWALAGAALVVVALNVAVIAFDPPRVGPSGLAMPASPGRAWMHLLKPYQEARIASSLSQLDTQLTALRPLLSGKPVAPAATPTPGESRPREQTRYSQNFGYQQNIAMTLAGAGGLWGYGAKRSAVIFHANYLPENHNDMIFAVIVNRWGFFGGAGVILLFLLLVCSLMLIAGRSKDPFARLACVGLAGLTFTQVVINIGMTLGLGPITGITLPFVSYGGSSLLTALAMIGLAINFASRRPAPLSRPSFQFDSSEPIFE